MTDLKSVIFYKSVTEYDTLTVYSVLTRKAPIIKNVLDKLGINGLLQRPIQKVHPDILTNAFC